jgi:hypothetical protein
MMPRLPPPPPQPNLVPEAAALPLDLAS